MLDNLQAINTLHQALLTESMDSRMSFSSLRTDWGTSGSKSFGEKQSQFCKSLRVLAARCPLKFYGGNYYLFNGKVYEVCDLDIIEMAYQQLMEDFQIAPMMNRLNVRNEVFLKTIRMCNPLRPSFDVVAFRNGVVDFGSGMKNPPVMPFSPEYHVTYYHPYDFNPKAKCDRFMSFLHEVLPDRTSRMILQMFLGLGLIQRCAAYNRHDGRNSASKVELCLLLIGGGANGKSVLFDVACHVFGPDKISKMDYADLTADGDEGLRGRLPLRNAIFNWSSDSDPKRFGRRNTGMFKRIVSGEPVPMRELGKNIMEADAIPYLIFNLNALPLSDDASLGFIRRLQYVSFDVTIPRDRQDPELASKIINSELSGVFQWVFRGAQELRRRKFQFPAAEASKKQLLSSLLCSNPVLAWIRSYSIGSEAAYSGQIYNWFQAGEMYNHMVAFCRANNVDEKDIPTVQKFGRVMSSVGFLRRREGRGYCYRMYGVTEPDFEQEITIDTIKPGGECDEPDEEFIKDDD